MVLKDILSLAGWCTLEKAKIIQDAIANLGGPLRGAEVGVFGGRSLIAAALAAQTWEGGFIIGVDPYTASDATAQQDAGNIAWWGMLNWDSVHAEAMAAIRRFGVQEHCGILRTTSRAASLIVGPLNYLHIDGNHAEGVAVDDVGRWLPKVQPGGVVVLDDTDYPSVQAARRMILDGCDVIEARPTFEVYRKR